MNKIQCPINAGAQHSNTLPALIAGDMKLSYGDYEQFVATTAVSLQEAGIAGGERVAIIAGNRWDYPILLFALWRAGAVACPISPRFPEEAIRGLLKKIDCRIIVDPADKVSNGEAGIRKIDLDLIQKGKASDDAKTAAPVTWDLDDDATIVFTSGSSAQPKAVLHTLSNHYFNALGSNRNIPVEAADRWLLSLPLFHVGGIGILFRMALGAGAVVIPAEKEPTAESMTRCEITHLSLVSTQLHRLLDDPPSAKVKKHVKALLAGGSALSSSAVSKAHEAGLPIYTTYGLTEMASQVTTSGPREALARMPNSGRVLDYRQLKIDDGEILVKGETLFKGYVDQESTILPVDENGWFRTGDVGRLDGDGALRSLGRKDNMFISGGENIHPEEIEGALYRVSDASDVIVVPVEDEEFGFRPVAFVRLKGDSKIDEVEIFSHLERYLPRFKIPIRFFQWPEKMTDAGLKPRRRHFRELAKREMRG